MLSQHQEQTEAGNMTPVPKDSGALGQQTSEKLSHTRITLCKCLKSFTTHFHIRNLSSSYLACKCSLLENIEIPSSLAQGSCEEHPAPVLGKEDSASNLRFFMLQMGEVPQRGRWRSGLTQYLPLSLGDVDITRFLPHQ